MRAIRIQRFGPPEVLNLEDIPRPVPAAGEVLVEVHAAGVGPWDGWIRAGHSVLPQPLPLTPGSDIAGVVCEIGPQVNNVKPGDEIYGVTNARFTNGYADYAVAAAAMVARRPARAGFIEAASMPVVAVTAWQMLFDHARIKAGDRVLILGAAGNVGGYAVQLAHQHGARVIAVIHSDEGSRLAALGADEVLDTRHGSIADLHPPVDAVIDAAGGPDQRPALAVLKRGGLLISAVSAPDATLLAAYKVRGHFFLVNTTAACLDQIAALFDAGKLTAQVGIVLPLEDARRAHDMLEGTWSRPRGKIVLAVTKEGR